MSADEIVRIALSLSRPPFDIEWSRSRQAFVCQMCKAGSADARIKHEEKWNDGMKVLEDEA